VRPLAITLGDPAGIGPEVVFKALHSRGHAPVWIFGSWRHARKTIEQLEIAQRFQIVPSSALANEEESYFIDTGDDGSDIEFGKVQKTSGESSLAAIEAAIEVMKHGLCSGLVTGPISKEAVAQTLPQFRGHTELLAERCDLQQYGRDFAMYFDSPRLKVALLTVHEPLSNALASITADQVTELAILISREFERLHSRVPKIGVAAINPHAGETGLFGADEAKIVQGVAAARAAGASIEGPFPADTLFMKASRGSYDVVLAMYHDQGLIPVKTLDFEHSVNVTLGLPFLRCSVDHGTAFDIAGKGIADPAPMRFAIDWAFEHGERYSR
jgi:4-hydroxythreonine-4-phosphate dehydrogenase